MEDRPIKIVFDEKYSKAAKALIDMAQTEILISTYKLQGHRKPQVNAVAFLIKDLTKAIGRGVQCKILMHHSAGNGSPPQANLPTAEILKSKGAEIRYLPGGRIVHAKLLVVDANIMIAGSHNWSKSALMSNFEVSLQVHDKIAIQEVRNIFLKVWSQAVALR
jgi:phosphatidylserine/phosphatidylglycerophosphate/cardiolipin synthase-like enzyme